MQLVQSAGMLFWHSARRIYTLVPAALLDPFDIAERYFGVTYQVATPVIWLVFAAGVFVAVTLAYHDIRMIAKGTQRQEDNRAEIRKVID